MHRGGAARMPRWLTGQDVSGSNPLLKAKSSLIPEILAACIVGIVP
jgi:hypothetical protein